MIDTRYLSDDAPIVENEHGGKGAYTPYRFDLIPPEVVFAIAERLGFGARKYEDWNWLKVTPDEHLSHLLQHIYALQLGDTSDDHAAAMLARAVFLYYALVVQGKQLRYNTLKKEVNNVQS